MNTLRHSNRQLSAIGRNLNQITRVLNTDFRFSDKVDKELVNGLKEQIELHVAKVVSLIDRSNERGR